MVLYVPLPRNEAQRLAIMGVLENVKDNSHKHRTRDDDFWLMMLLEEVSELVLSLRGEHGDPPDLELTEIAGICINWLAKRASEKED